MPIHGDDGPNERIRTIQRTLLAYWLAHPEAKDSVEGIVHWWLPAEGAAWSAGELVAALEALVERGWLTAGGRTTRSRVYGLGGASPEELRRFLER